MEFQIDYGNVPLKKPTKIAAGNHGRRLLDYLHIRMCEFIR